MHIKHDWWFQRKNNHLTLKKHSNSGRGSGGSRIIRTKSAILRKLKSININYSYRYKPLGLITSFQLIPYRNLLVSLVLYSNGSLSYFTKGYNHKNFKYIIFATNYLERSFTKHSFIS